MAEIKREPDNELLLQILSKENVEKARTIAHRLLAECAGESFGCSIIAVGMLAAELSGQHGEQSIERDLDAASCVARLHFFEVKHGMRAIDDAIALMDPIMRAEMELAAWLGGSKN